MDPRWNCKEGRFVERPDVDRLIEEILAACRKHSMSLSHEDTHGAFVIEAFSEKKAAWLKDAMINCDEEKVKLKPCPFCGGEAESQAKSSGWYQVSCEGHNEACWTSTRWYSKREYAVKAWNTRAPLPVREFLTIEEN